ncbi:MBL fold metallo-hydrolase [Oceaniglobus indicus]|uniref:MBL fold metallo-hydrolase n=1 Tax=Oceaniglobus indicus TaxID=2047749 RepID=UPI000C18086F|nr:MBL fold metallo-hydrolase [Oceaniglobus indicus]
MFLAEAPCPAPLAEVLAKPPGREVMLYWLGQAGFVIDGAHRRLVIDPYLSDSLAEKYRGTAFPHVRLMPPPVLPHEIRHVDAVLATHAHSDHLDPGTLPALMATNPGAPLIAPRAVCQTALERAALSPDRLVAMDTGQTVHPAAGLAITATRAAHEDLARDDGGHHMFLGYAMTLGGVCIFHPGDTIPFDGQTAEVAALRADIALLPVNGRDADRAANGVPGNLTPQEALTLARETGIGAVIAHHFDLFAFNTVPRAEVEEMARAAHPLTWRAARTGVAFIPHPRPGSPR